MSMKLNARYASEFIEQHEMDAMAPQIRLAHDLLHNGKGPGSEFTGWLNLPTGYDKQEFARIQTAAKTIQQNSDILIVIGIGGSYLGARAVIEFLHSAHYNELRKGTPAIYFAGNSISSSDLNELLQICEGKEISINVISKSGTTTEPAIAFRVFKNLLETKYGANEAAKRIFVTTDKAKGTLKGLSDRMGYETFVVPDDIGGRFSVLTAVGLLPIAVSGADIAMLMHGAQQAQTELANPDMHQNDCYQYAAIRNILYRKGKQLELLVSYEPRFALMAEWFKQLYGESEGKDNKGIFPASCVFSTDLHSLGQYIQSGARHLFETVVTFKAPKQEYTIPTDPEDIDGLNFLAGKGVSFVNQKAFEGTVLAHTDGGVPNILLEVSAVNEEELGYMIYFFEKACAISGYVLGVNPFDQPGVESYKRNMFALLGKPGYEKERAALEARLG